MIENGKMESKKKDKTSWNNYKDDVKTMEKKNYGLDAH